MTDGERFRACLQCGTCSGICPFGFFMDFPPGRMITALRADVFEEVLGTDSVWMCVSCYACTQYYPAKIPITAGLMTRSKEELILAGRVPTELQNALENSQRYGNPMGESPRKRADWSTGIEPKVAILGMARRPVDVLWFVGDYPSYHPRVQVTTRALAKVSQCPGDSPAVSSHALLGNLFGHRGRMRGRRTEPLLRPAPALRQKRAASLR